MFMGVLFVVYGVGWVGVLSGQRVDHSNRSAAMKSRIRPTDGANSLRESEISQGLS